MASSSPLLGADASSSSSSMKEYLFRARPTSRNRRFSTILTLLLATLLAMLALLFLLGGLAPCTASAHCYHGYSSDYSFSATAAAPWRSAWMASIPDAVNLSSLSIPGTHDTMTYDLDDNDLLQCQNVDLAVQLRAGVRYLDIRGRQSNGTLWIYHAWGWTGHTFADVLATVFAFLDENPGEAVVMRLKEEGGPVGHDPGTTFEEVFLRFLNEDPATAQPFQKHLFLPPPPAAAGPGPKDAVSPLPALGDLRGKILLLQEFPTARGQGPYGVVWDSPQMVLEDLWQIRGKDFLWQKWDAVEDALVQARDRDDDNSVLFVSHLSCSFGVLPIEAAAGPLGEPDEEEGGIVGINDQTGRWLEEAAPEERGRTGVVIIDFPGQELVDAVLERNGVFVEGGKIIPTKIIPTLP